MLILILIIRLKIYFDFQKKTPPKMWSDRQINSCIEIVPKSHYSLATLKFRINDLFVYSGHFVIQKGVGNIVFLFLNKKMS
jgi:hypothetical protein